ncbi:FERM domain-containing protein 8 Bili isoform X2 [Dermacentor variabilis]|uniref:FERM domain-containing protein 8 Bili isoform X2 n=1 Tax=Dermacentor variabilis TaxID=34621 RepID=UPI003F5BCC37
MESTEGVQRRARLVSMRDLVPEDSSGSSSSDEEESSSMMKHHQQQQPDQQGPCENYMTHNCVTIIPVEYPRSDSSPLSACTLRGGPAAVGGGGDKRGDYATLDHRHGHHHHHHSAPSPYAVSVPALATTTTTTRRQLPTPTHHHSHHNQYHQHPAAGASHHHLHQHHNHVRPQQCYQLPPLSTVGHGHDDVPGWRILPTPAARDHLVPPPAPAPTPNLAPPLAPAPQQRPVTPPPAPVPPPKQEMCVYLMNKVCLCVEVGNVQLATAHEIIDIIAEDDTEINFPAQLKDVFALWMTSPLLELQLKPDHRPYLIRERWSEYLKKYTFATKQQLDSDEPVLTLQRNVFLEKSKEKEVTDLKLLKMLFAEAKGNVLDGRYPCETEDCMVLGAIQARLELGPYDPLKHTPEFFRSRIRDFLPEHACRSHWFLLGLGAKNGPERRLSEHYKAIASNVKDSRLMRKYLEFCWAFPYYGSAFFSGQVERPVTGIAALMNHYDLPVLVAINRDGVHVMDPSQPVVLLSLPYKQLSWDYACPTQPDNPDCLPCLFLQFQLPGQNETSVLQIFSRQAILMDALISTIVDELKKRASWIEANVETTAVSSRADDDIQVPLTVKKLRQEQGLSGRLRKLSIAKFNSSGDYLNSKGSLEFRRDDRPR